MDEMLYFENDGPIISRTNYFKSTYEKNNIVFLSWNANTARVLIPDGLKADLQEMCGTKQVIISRGYWTEMGVANAIELLFEDESDNPYCIFLSPEQTDRVIPEAAQGGSDNFFVSIYIRMGEKFRFPAKYRIVDTIPYLKPWKEH